MKASEIKNGTNDDLIMRLCACAYGTRLTKQQEKDAERISAELVRRGIVSPDFIQRCMRLMKA